MNSPGQTVANNDQLDAVSEPKLSRTSIRELLVLQCFIALILFLEIRIFTDTLISFVAFPVFLTTWIAVRSYTSRSIPRVNPFSMGVFTTTSSLALVTAISGRPLPPSENVISYSVFCLVSGFGVGLLLGFVAIVLADFFVMVGSLFRSIANRCGRKDNCQKELPASVGGLPIDQTNSGHQTTDDRHH